MWKFSPIFLNDGRNPNAGPQSGRSGSNAAICESRIGAPYSYYCPSVGQNSNHDQGIPDPLTQCISAFFWLGILIFISYPIAILALLIFIAISPISVFIPSFLAMNDFLLKVAHFPIYCTRSLLDAKTPECC